MTTSPDLTVGEAVLYPREQAVGLIYAVYERGRGERPGVQLLLSDGRDLSGFSAEEADQFLRTVGHTGLEYEFRNVGQLHADYQRGVFAPAFATARLLAGFREIKYLNAR
ncbi:hypothetical protein ACFQ48_18535 [Hymenobacter caeli]|uniref:Uncharacterized protein n=1 Tax=Hymenobacter caeli TaxID=2735894 RepID=A0ABX2FX56_9BACT|nr:hypothetical protein [Hymenobacter caeli]NRT20945.1 hypothetical protein [Hymenobacter caeli]